jgi:hypothetical protein
MSDECIVVFTAEGPGLILQQGGSRAWVLKPVHARKCSYLVCTQRRDPKLSNLGASEPSHAAFMVGKISDVIPDSTEKDRWQICISEYALLTVMDVWPGHRNPVWYPTLAKIGIDLKALEFKPISE